MFLYLYLILGFPLLLVFCIFLNCSQSESDKKIHDLEDKVNKQNLQIENFDMLLGHFRRKAVYSDYSLSGRITELENELKKLKKEIKK